MPAQDYADEMRRLSANLDSALSLLEDQARKLADAEAEYRKLKAKCWVQAPEGTVPERQAWVDAECADARHARDVAEGLRQAALESVRSRRTQISAIQSLLAGDREEAAFTRTGEAA